MKTQNTLTRRLLQAGLLSLNMVLAAPSFAQGARIGFVNSDRMLREAEPARAAQAKLELEFSRREKELNDACNALRAASEKFERDAPTLSDTQRNQRQRQLQEQDRDFQRKSREFQEDLNARRNEELQAVLDRANRVVKQVASGSWHQAHTGRRLPVLSAVTAAA